MTSKTNQISDEERDELITDLQLYGSAFFRFTKEGLERIDPRELLREAEIFSADKRFADDPRERNHHGPKRNQ